MKRRIRRSDPERRTYWEDVVRRWKESGQSVCGYCRTQGLRESAFFFWRRELAQSRQLSGAARQPQSAVSQVAPAARSPKRRLPSPTRFAGAPDMASFLPVRVVEDTAVEVTHGVEIVLARGRTVRVPPGFDRQTLADVLSVLEVQPC